MLRVAFLALISLAIISVNGSASKIDPSLKTVLKEKGTANVFITFNVGTASILSSFNQLHFETRADRLTALTSALRQHAASTQQDVLEFLRSTDSVSVTSFWINNQIFVSNAHLALVESLARFPEVSEIVEEQTFEIDVPVQSEESNVPQPRAAEWGVEKIEAPQAWAIEGENDGKGVIVATIDTGVLGEHQDLESNFLGAYGWFDPYKFTPTPNDQNGHGTHTTGTICGQGGIGVAPGARWMACKGCATSSCAQAQLISCGQFMVCPTNPEGTEEDCSYAPRLVSNSWGGGQGRDMFHEVIDAWTAAEIIPLFSNGNSGPTCGSANSPADHPDVIGVGSTTSVDALSSFSSVGPSVYGTLKPDISAPGSSVRSSYNSGVQGYATLSGTSMACPHVAGVVAILLSHTPNLTFDEVKHYLSTGADQKTLALTGRNCGGIAEDVFPNHAYGPGRTNAKNSLICLQTKCQ